MTENRVLGLVLTLSIAFAGGWLCEYAGLPAPYLLGSLAGVWITGLSWRPVRSMLGVPRQLHVPIVLALGVMIGAMFTPELLSSAGRWLGSLSMLLAATLVATLAGVLFLTRVRGYDVKLATLCSLPGGQAELVILSRELVDKDYVVALCHLVRVALVFIATPFILTVVEGSAGVERSHQIMDTLPGMRDLSAAQMLQFAALALGGFAAGKLVRLPMPHLLGPLLASAVAHLTGFVAIPRISELILLAQVTIGGAVGANLSRAPLAKLPGYLRDGLVNAFLIISIYASFAWILSQTTALTFMNVFLAFIPGGLYEVTLLTLLFGFDVVFVVVHHTIRVLIIFSAIPILVSRYHKERQGAGARRDR